MAPSSMVPYAVMTLGDDAVEFGIVDRMISDRHRQALVGEIEREALENRLPGQHSFMLEPEFLVQAAGAVLPHHDAARPGPRRRFAALGSDPDVAPNSRFAL